MESKINILTKLKPLKSEIGKISKESTNPFFKSKYFDINQLLEHCEPLLNKYNLVLLQPIKNGVVSTIIYDVATGEKIKSSLALPTIQDPQKLGSAITYFRRYTLQSLLGLQAEDDDANKASKHIKKTNVKPKRELDENGFNFLISKGTKEQIELSLKERVLSKEYKSALTLKLESL